MSRGKWVLMVGAVIVGICAAAGVILIGTAVDKDARDDPPLSARGQQHGADELRTPDIGDLPAAEEATRTFMRGYLALITGRDGARPDRVQAASPELIAQLQQEAARVTPAQQDKALRVASVAVTFAETRGAATASVQIAGPDAPTFLMTLRLERGARGWRVVRLRA